MEFREKGAACEFAAPFGLTSSVGSAVDGQARPGDVGGLGAGYKGYKSGYLVHSSIAVERRIGFLWRCPSARSGIEIGVDRTGLNIVDRNTAVAHFSGKTLSKHLYGTLGSSIGSQSR